MGASNSSQLDETTSSHIREHIEAELKGFSPHLRQQYRVSLCSKLQEELEQQNTSPALLLKQREASEVLYEASVSQCEDGKKWKERWAVVRDHCLELYDNQEMCKKGTPARQRLVLVGGAVATSTEKYEALVNKAIPDLNNGQENSAPELLPPTAFPVYLRLPYRCDVYLCCHDNEQRRQFLSTLSHGIRHQNHDSLHKPTFETGAFLAAIHFYRQEKGHYESWDMLVGDDTQVLTHLVMEGLIPFLQKELLPQLKGKMAEKRRTWLSLVEAAHSQVLAQVQEVLQTLKEECSTAAQQQGVVLRSNMDQIISSRAFLETKLQAMVSEQAQSVCAEHVTPYLSSVLEELLGPVNGGFQAVRQLFEEQLDQLCRDVCQGWTFQQVKQALQQTSKPELEESFHKLEVLHERLQELQQRFSYTNTTKLVQGAQRHMQQLMDNAMYTFETLLQSAVKDNPAQLASVMEKAKLRVLKQYDYDSSTVRKRFFQEVLMDITLPVLRRHLGPSCRPDLEKFEQYIFADCTDFINVENVYEDILKKILTPEVNKVVKEAASQKKHNLFVDSADLQAISQGSLSGTRTPPPHSPPPSSPSKQVEATRSQPQQAELKPSPLASSTGELKEPQENTVGQLDLSEKPVEEVKEEKEEETAKEEGEPSKQKQEVTEQANVPHVDSPPAEIKEEVSTEPVSSPDALSSLIEPDPVTTDSSIVRTDRAVYLNPPAGVPAGSAVPLCEDDSTYPALTPVAEDSNEPPEGSNEPAMEITAAPPAPVTALAGGKESMEESEGEGGSGGDPEGTEGGQAASEGESISSGLMTSEPTVEGATSITNNGQKEEEKMEEEEEEDQPLDCVKAIRDLVVEVIEVEDVIRPRPDSRPN